MLDRQHRHLTTTHSLHRHGLLLSFIYTTAALLFCVPAHAAPIDIEIAYTYDDNITRAQRDSDILDDRFLSLQAGTSYLQWLNQNNRIIYRGFARGEFYDEYEKLSNATVGVNATYQYRASGAFTSPTYGAFVKAAINEYGKSELRDSDLLSVGVSFRKPFTDRVVYTAMLSYNVRDSDSTVWDTKEASLLQNVDYSLAERWTVYLTYNLLHGDAVSSLNTSNYGALPLVNALVDVAKAINTDDAFGSGNWVAYRLRGTTHVVTFGTNFSISENHSLDTSVRYANSSADGDVEYERWMVSLAYLIRL